MKCRIESAAEAISVDFPFLLEDCAGANRLHRCPLEWACWGRVFTTDVVVVVRIGRPKGGPLHMAESGGGGGGGDGKSRIDHFAAKCDDEDVVGWFDWFVHSPAPFPN